MSHRRLFGPALTVLLAALLVGCGEDEDKSPLTRNLSLSGKVTNKTPASGSLIVEIDYNLKDVADGEGHWAIPVHQDFLVDSLYAYVDSDGNGSWSNGEPFGFYHSDAQPNRAKSVHVRNSDVPNLDITIE
jgi:hypothetical protein